MYVLWDEPKRLIDLSKHELDFADLQEGFDFENAVAFEASVSGSGRVRIRLIGTLFGTLVVALIVSPLGREAISVVSLRKASRKERTCLTLEKLRNKGLIGPRKT